MASLVESKESTTSLVEVSRIVGNRGGRLAISKLVGGYSHAGMQGSVV